MATVTRASMIESITNNDEWLNRAVLRLATECSNNALPFTLSDDQRYTLDYWSGWVRSKRNLTGTHRDDAIRFVTESQCADFLWQHIVNTNKGVTK